SCETRYRWWEESRLILRILCGELVVQSPQDPRRMWTRAFESSIIPIRRSFAFSRADKGYGTRFGGASAISPALAAARYFTDTNPAPWRLGIPSTETMMSRIPGWTVIGTRTFTWKIPETMPGAEPA